VTCHLFRNKLTRAGREFAGFVNATKTDSNNEMRLVESHHRLQRRSLKPFLHSLCSRPYSWTKTGVTVFNCVFWRKLWKKKFEQRQDAEQSIKQNWPHNITSSEYFSKKFCVWRLNKSLVYKNVKNPNIFRKNSNAFLRQRMNWGCREIRLDVASTT